jgi:hypothetical protein
MRLGRRLSVGRDRSQLEANLRQYYTSAVGEGWDRETEGRIHARVSRAIAAQRTEARASGGTFRLKRVMGPHVAALICAGALVIAFSGMIDGGHGGSQAQVQPTSAPLTGQPARSNGYARLSLGLVQPPANMAIAL